MEQQILNLQTEYIFLQKQYNQLYNKGKKMQQKILSILQSPPFNSEIKIFDLIEAENHNSLSFIMFGNLFSIYVECAFDESGSWTDGYLKTYTSLNGDQVIYSVAFDRIGNINRCYTIDDFAVPYLMNVVASFKKSVAELHLKDNFTIKLRQI